MFPYCREGNYGVIDYVRGQITVLDRRKLEKLIGECYSVVKSQESDRLVAIRTSCNTTP
jgi:hypothetical protein